MHHWQQEQELVVQESAVSDKCDPESRVLVLSPVEFLCNRRHIPVLVPFYRITPEPLLATSGLMKVFPFACELKKKKTVSEMRVKSEWYLQMYRELYMFLWWVVVLHHQTHHQSLLQVFSSQSPGFALLCNCHRGCSREEKHSNYSNPPQQQREPLCHQAWGKGKNPTGAAQWLQSYLGIHS